MTGGDRTFSFIKGSNQNENSVSLSKFSEFDGDTKKNMMKRLEDCIITSHFYVITEEVKESQSYYFWSSPVYIGNNRYYFGLHDKEEYKTFYETYVKDKEEIVIDKSKTSDWTTLHTMNQSLYRFILSVSKFYIQRYMFGSEKLSY